MLYRVTPPTSGPRVSPAPSKVVFHLATYESWTTTFGTSRASRNRRRTSPSPARGGTLYQRSAAAAFIQLGGGTNTQFPLAIFQYIPSWAACHIGLSLM